MSGIAQIISGISGLTGSSGIPNITNPLISPQAGFNAVSGIGLSPEQEALVAFLGGQQDERTRDIYARLGLSGSTMMAQDLGSNELQRLAQSAGLITQNQQLGITEQQVATNAGLQTEQLQLSAANAANAANQRALNNLVAGLGSIGGGASRAITGGGTGANTGTLATS